MAEHETTHDDESIAGKTRRQAADQAGRIAGKARERVVDQFETQKERGAGQLDEVAEAVRAGGERLRNARHDDMARYVEAAADQVERLSSRLREAEPRELLENLRDLARWHPAVFVGSAAVLGIVGARFFASSDNGADQPAQAGDRLTEADDWMERDGGSAFIRRNPLLIGAGALALGAAIGAALPLTRAEARVMAPARKRVVERARTGARRAVEEARVAGGKMAADAVNRMVSGKPS